MVFGSTKEGKLFSQQVFDPNGAKAKRGKNKTLKKSIVANYGGNNGDYFERNPETVDAQSSSVPWLSANVTFICHPCST